MTLEEAHATLNALANARKQWFKATPHEIESVAKANIEATAKAALALFNEQDAYIMALSGKPLPTETRQARSWDGCGEDIRNNWRRAVAQGCHVKVYS